MAGDARAVAENVMNQIAVGAWQFCSREWNIENCAKAITAHTDQSCSDLARKVLEVVNDERLGDNLDNEGDIAYAAALDHVTTALRKLFAKEGIDVNSER